MWTVSVRSSAGKHRKTRRGKPHKSDGLERVLWQTGGKKCPSTRGQSLGFGSRVTSENHAHDGRRSKQREQRRKQKSIPCAYPDLWRCDCTESSAQWEEDDLIQQAESEIKQSVHTLYLLCYILQSRRGTRFC